MKVHAMSGDPRQLFRMAPLTALSPASDIQFRYLKELSAEIRTLLKEMWDSPGVINEKGPKVPARFWLWTLGSYELARTLRL